jgi:hypothetical protein
MRPGNSTQGIAARYATHCLLSLRIDDPSTGDTDGAAGIHVDRISRRSGIELNTAVRLEGTVMLTEVLALAPNVPVWAKVGALPVLQLAPVSKPVPVPPMQVWPMRRRATGRFRPTKERPAGRAAASR